MIRTQVLLTPTLYELLKLRAQEESKSLSAVVREAVERLIKPKRKIGREIFAAMKKGIGSNPKGPKDLSVNDDYLYRLP